MSLWQKLKNFLLVDESKLPNLDALSQEEHFIPIYFTDILEKALADKRLDATEKKKMQTLAEMFTEHYHLDYHKKFLKLKRAFAPFDPDAEVRYEEPHTEEYKEICREELIQGIRDFLTVCNFCEMSEEKLNEILDAPYNGALTIAVDMNKLEFFHVYYRGVVDEQHTIKKYGLQKTYPSKVFKRIFVLARYKNAYGGQVLAKVFRDVPAENLKVVVPEVKLLLPLFDKLKVGASFGGALLTFVAKLILAAALSVIALCIMLFAFVMGFIRSVMGFFTSRMKCLKTYSESLYHQSLAGNMGAVNYLVEQAETQEVKEAFLAYFILYVMCKEDLTEKKLDESVEAWLQENFGFYIDFEVDDALRKLVAKKLVVKNRAMKMLAVKKLVKKVPLKKKSLKKMIVVKKLVTQTTPGGGSEPYYKVYNLPSALRRLDELWDNYHLENNEGDASNDVLAC